jgi:hypothetical protein
MDLTVLSNDNECPRNATTTNDGCCCCCLGWSRCPPLGHCVVVALPSSFEWGTAPHILNRGRGAVPHLPVCRYLGWGTAHHFLSVTLIRNGSSTLFVVMVQPLSLGMGGGSLAPWHPPIIVRDGKWFPVSSASSPPIVMWSSQGRESPTASAASSHHSR